MPPWETMQLEPVAFEKDDDTNHKFPELSLKKMDETYALPEPALRLSKMTILLMKVRLVYLESRFFLSWVCMRTCPLKFKRSTAGIESDLELDL